LLLVLQVSRTLRAPPVPLRDAGQDGGVGQVAFVIL
jgi:hypothetical protein